MRLEHLFDGETWYDGAEAWIYGAGEASGYAEGNGEVRGPRITGALRWSNGPRRRQDGVWVTDLRGFIATADGAEVLIELKGRSLPEEAPGDPRDVLCAISMRSADERYRWLDDVMGVVEGRFDPNEGRMRLRAYTCVNELG